MNRYFWKSAGRPWQSLPLLRQTEKFYTFEHTKLSEDEAGRPWRMSSATLENYIKNRVIVVVQTQLMEVSQQQYKAMEELPAAIDALLASIQTDSPSQEWLKVNELLTKWENYDDRLTTQKGIKP